MARTRNLKNPANMQALAALERLLRRSDGFRLAFAVVNHPSLREPLAEAVRRACQAP